MPMKLYTFVTFHRVYPLDACIHFGALHLWIDYIVVAILLKGKQDGYNLFLICKRQKVVIR